ncbi:MAG: hypothetical protein IPJ38_14100 [Dechloromonas sp.]|uniref:Uncharacterized protein n=1 Tax=Candidatus Dechloromonas phosphorivorans TaxID=2899244 RepID=A0A935K3R2_9RHOO|nr:hypothetical protein [Candidatus Dechloromonas phosphorivorans]
MNPLSPLGQEWTTLQYNHEQYERSSMLIKLAAVLFSLFGLMFDIPALYLVALLLILWLMEGIFRTSQARLGARLLKLEEFLRQNPLPESAAYQLHSTWLASRPGTLGLIGEYLANAARPTVAFPYAILVILSAFL